MYSLVFRPNLDLFFSLDSYNNQLDSDNSLSSIAITFSLSLAAAAVIGFVVYRYTKKGEFIMLISVSLCEFE